MSSRKQVQRIETLGKQFIANFRAEKITEAEESELLFQLLRARIIVHLRLKYRICNQDYLEEIFQKFILRFIEKQKLYNIDLPLWPYLKVMAEHVASDFLAVANSARTEIVSEKNLDQRGDNGSGVSSIQRSTFAFQLLSMLDDEKRSLLCLRYLDGLTLEEIARQMSLSVSTVYDRIESAKAILRKSGETKTTAREG